MSKVDVTIALMIFVGAYSGSRDGIFLELFSFFGVLLGVLFGFKLMGWAMMEMERAFFIDEKALPYIAFTCIFFIVVFLVNFIGRFVKPPTGDGIPQAADKIGGAFIGFFRTAFMLSVILWLIDALQFDFPKDWFKDSWVFPLVADFAPATAHAISKIIPFFHDVF